MAVKPEHLTARIDCAKTGERYSITVNAGYFECPGCGRKHKA